MDNNAVLKTFPSTKGEALTLLYLQNQDISHLSPEELVAKYNEIYAIVKTAITVPKKDSHQKASY